ncbi:sensor histidine kinase [Micromonosporaceae bacterium Da 78-11]
MAARWPAWLPRVLVVGFAVLTSASAAGLVYGPPAGGPVLPIALFQSTVVVAAPFRPVPAWWAAILALILGALTDGASFPWRISAILPVAAVLFLLALRVRPRILLAVLTTGLLAVLAATGFQLDHPPGYGLLGLATSTDPGRAGLLLAAAAGAGMLRRARRDNEARLAEQVALAAEERDRRALLEERGRIARELHDVVAHHLSVISIQAQVAPLLVDDPPAELRENLTGIRQSALDALTELRRVLGVLRSEDVQHAPQPTLAEVDELIGNVRAAGVAVTIETTGTPRPLSPGVELSAYRIVQESLSNAVRHAPGAAVQVLIAYDPAGLGVRVGNAAPTRPARPLPSVGHGLLGMRERVTMLGGDLTAGPTPDGGYEVTAALPAAG